MDGAVYKVYRNSLENMKGTKEDWEKVLGAFEKLWTPERAEDVLACIRRLEEYVDGNNVTD